MCGGYPLGAANDPRAPYNQPDSVEVECPDCAGTGYAEEPYALDLDAYMASKRQYTRQEADRAALL